MEEEYVARWQKKSLAFKGHTTIYRLPQNHSLRGCFVRISSKAWI